MSWGVHPKAMIGHSLGEYVAATIGGTFDRNDALVLLARRRRPDASTARRQDASRPGAAARLTSYLTGDHSIATYNSPGLVVVSGGSTMIDDLEKKLKGDSIACRPIQTSHAFHSAMMDPIVDAYKDLVHAARPKPPQLPWISCRPGPRHRGGGLRSGILGTSIAATRPILRRHWPPARQSARTARDRARPNTGDAGPTAWPRKSAQPVIATLRVEASELGELASTLEAIGQLWAAGCEIDWRAFNEGHRRRRISLPTYPFERTRYGSIRLEYTAHSLPRPLAGAGKSANSGSPMSK